MLASLRNAAFADYPIPALHCPALDARRGFLGIFQADVLKLLNLFCLLIVAPLGERQNLLLQNLQETQDLLLAAIWSSAMSKHHWMLLGFITALLTVLDLKVSFWQGKRKRKRVLRTVRGLRPSLRKAILDDDFRTQDQVRLVFDFINLQLDFIFGSPPKRHFVYQLVFGICYIGCGQGRRQSTVLPGYILQFREHLRQWISEPGHPQPRKDDYRGYCRLREGNAQRIRALIVDLLMLRLVLPLRVHLFNSVSPLQTVSLTLT